MTEVALTFFGTQVLQKQNKFAHVKKKLYLCTRFRNAESTIAFFALIHKFGIAEFLPDLFPFVA